MPCSCPTPYATSTKTYGDKHQISFCSSNANLLVVTDDSDNVVDCFEIKDKEHTVISYNTSESAFTIEPNGSISNYYSKDCYEKIMLRKIYFPDGSGSKEIVIIGVDDEIDLQGADIFALGRGEQMSIYFDATLDKKFWFVPKNDVSANKPTKNYIHASQIDGRVLDI